MESHQRHDHDGVEPTGQPYPRVLAFEEWEPREDVEALLGPVFDFTLRSDVVVVKINRPTLYEWDVKVLCTTRPKSVHDVRIPARIATTHAREIIESSVDAWRAANLTHPRAAM